MAPKKEPTKKPAKRGTKRPAPAAVKGPAKQPAKRPTRGPTLAGPEDFYRTVFAQSREASLLTASDGRIFRANAAACALLRRSEEEICAAGRQGLVDPASPGLEHLLAVRAETGQVQGELVFLRGDGTRLLAELRSASLFGNAKSSEVRNIVTLRDLTEHRATEHALQARAEELRASEERFRAMVERSPTGTVIFEAGRITYANPASARIIGADAIAPLIGRSVMDFVHPEHRGRALERIKHAVTTGQASEPAEMVFLDLNRQSIDAESVVLPVAIGGRPSIMVLFNDITERKRATIALRDSEAQLRAVVELSPNGIVILGDGRLTYANPAAARILRASGPAQLVGRETKDFVHPDRLSQTLERLRLVMESGQAVPQIETLYLRCDGTAVEVESVARPITIGGRAASLVIFQDITARKTQEKALRDNELKYRTLFESADDAIMLLADGRFVDCNAATLRMFGCTREQFIGATPSAFSPPRQLDGMPSDVAAARKIELALSEGPQTFEWEHCRVDGTPFAVEVSLNRLDLGGQPRIQAMVRDVTARRAAETALRSSEERFRAVFSEAPLGIAVVDSYTGRMLAVNRQFAEIAARPAEELTRIDWMSITHPDDVAEDQRNMSLLNAGTISRFHMRKRYRRPDGSYVWISMTVAPIREPGRPHEAHVCMVEDISARIAAEEELRKLSRAVEQSQASIVITNVAADIEYVNEAFLRRTGYTRQEILGRNPRILQSGETPRATHAALWLALQRGETWSGEFTNRKKDGTTFVEQAVISPLRQPDGTITHYVAVKEDITDQKRLTAELARHRDHLMELVEERTRELEEARTLAESANKAKSAFLATMSHEIRTPLNGVIAMAEMLALRPLPSEDHESTKTILRSAHNLLAVIDDILDFSKIEAGKLELEVADLPLCLVADDVVVALEPVASAADVALAVHVAPEVPPHVRGDATRVRQILLNLGANAIKFSGGRPNRRGEVAIHVGVVSQSPLRVALQVTDNGIGMTPEIVGRLFQSFTQAEASTTRRFGGTGLGLAITKRLVDLMGGTIEVESAPERGSTFTVILPFATVGPTNCDAPMTHRTGAEPVAAADLRHRPLSLDEARSQGRLILVAEDDSMNQKVILQQLGLLGYAGQIAADGDEALRLWRAGGYAMLLSDLHMPNMDGYELSLIIRAEEPPGTHLPIFALTANALRGEAERATSAGMDGYLTKPVPLATLRDVLAQWIVPVSSSG